MIIRAVFRYRIPVAILAGLSALLPFQYARDGFSTEANYGALSIALLVMGLLLWGKASDIAEDTLNPRSLALNPAKRRAALIVGTILIALPLPWIIATSLYYLGGYLALAAFGYLFSFGVGGIRLKNIFVVKNLSVAGLWALAVSSPFYFLSPQVNPTFFIQSLATNALLMLCFDVLNDIRDAKGDRESGIRTIPNTLGNIAAKIVCLAAIGAYGAYMATFYVPGLPDVMAYFMLAALAVVATPRQHYMLFQIQPLIWMAMVAVTLIKRIVI